MQNTQSDRNAYVTKNYHVLMAGENDVLVEFINNLLIK